MQTRRRASLGGPLVNSSSREGHPHPHPYPYPNPTGHGNATRSRQSDVHMRNMRNMPSQGSEPEDQEATKQVIRGYSSNGDDGDGDDDDGENSTSNGYGNDNGNENENGNKGGNHKKERKGTQARQSLAPNFRVSRTDNDTDANDESSYVGYGGNEETDMEECDVPSETARDNHQSKPALTQQQQRQRRRSSSNVTFNEGHAPNEGERAPLQERDGNITGTSTALASYSSNSSNSNAMTNSIAHSASRPRTKPAKQRQSFSGAIPLASLNNNVLGSSNNGNTATTTTAATNGTARKPSAGPKSRQGSVSRRMSLDSSSHVHQHHQLSYQQTSLAGANHQGPGSATTYQLTSNKPRPAAYHPNEFAMSDHANSYTNTYSHAYPNNRAYYQQHHQHHKSQHHHHQEHYSFPILSADELVAALHPLNLGITNRDLDEPSPRIVRMVYEALCTMLLNVTLEELRQPVYSALDEAVDFPELHEESIPLFSLLRAVTKLMEMCLVYDTCLQDVTQPEHARFKRNLSAVVNYAKFRDDCIDEQSDLAAKLEEAQARLEASESNYQQLERELQEAQERSQGIMPELNKHQMKCSELEDSLREKNEEQERLQEETNRVKKEIEACKTETEEAQYEVLNLQEECKKLQASQVKSPRRIKNQLVHNKRKLEEEKLAVKDYEEDLKQLNTTKDLVPGYGEELRGLVTLAQQVETSMKQCKEAVTQKKSKQETIDAHNVAIREATTRKAELERQVKMAEERLTRLQNSYEKKRQDARKQLETMQKEKQSLEHDRKADSQKAEEARVELRRVRKQIESQRETRKANLENRRRAWLHIESQVERYNQKLLSEIASSS